METEFDMSWFNLTNYEPVQNFNIKDWHLQLRLRLDINMFLRPTVPMVKIMGEGAAITEHAKARVNLSLIKTHPILRRRLPLGDARESWQPIKGLQPPSIRDITSNEMELENDFISTIGEEELNFFNEFNGLFGAKIYVDLNATDNQLKADFNSWLKAKRKATERNVRKRGFTEIDFNKWKTYKILPYIDLILISHSQGKTLTQSQAGDLLFLNETIDRAEKIRKTIKPLAEEILTTKTICAIERQIGEV